VFVYVQELLQYKDLLPWMFILDRSRSGMSAPNLAPRRVGSWVLTLKVRSSSPHDWNHLFWLDVEEPELP